MRRRLGGLARVVFGLAGAAFLVVAFLQTWDRSQGALVPSWPRLVAALAAVTAGLVVALRAWAALLGVAPTRSLAAGFYLSQLGKYVPGAVWQAVGQVGYAAAGAVPVARAAVAFAVFALTQATAGGVVGAVVAVLAPGLPPMLRLLALAPAGLALLCDRRWMVRAVAFYERRRGRQAVDDLVPTQRAILVAVAWSALTQLLGGIAFALMLGGTAPGGSFVPAAVPGFALAWTVGFLALPFPAGLGVREAVLLAALAGAAPTAAVIAASVELRAVYMVGEVLLIVATRWLPVLPRSVPTHPDHRPP